MTGTKAPNPVLVEVVRSGFVESVHRGALVITRPDGSLRTALGDVTGPVFPRSANKPLQALGMLHAGLEIHDRDLALVAASHTGELGHIRTALALLAKADLTEEDLHCPLEPRRAAMNCSGKHAGMLTTCRQRGWPVTDYTDPEHELQRSIAATITEYTGEPITVTGTDGCGAPLFGFSLTGLAKAFTQLHNSRVAEAMRAQPWLVAGTGEDDTQLMLAVPGMLAKGGAEGVHAATFPDGTAMALKIDDGSTRGRAPLLIAALRAMGAVPEHSVDHTIVHGLERRSGTILGGDHEVGEVRVTEDCRAALAAA